MRYCNDCKKKFKLEDALVIKVETKEPYKERLFPWSELKNVIKKHPLCPHCKSINHFGTIE